MTLPHTTCVALGKSLPVSGSQFSHLLNGDNNTCLLGMFCESNEVMD